MADAPTETSGMGAALARLTRTRVATRAAIVFERLWPLALPPLVVVSLYLSLSWFGVFRLTPGWLRLPLLVAFALAALASLWPLRGFRRPTTAEVDRRIERANNLEHAPISTQTDRIAGDDAFSAALWREHQSRMADRLGRLSTDSPRTRVPERDPWGMRAVAALLLVTAFAFSLGPYGGRVTDAFHAGIGRPGVPPRIDAWITPPAYTGRAPIFLTSQANRARSDFTVPVNSSIAVRVTGGSGTEALSFVAPDGKETAIEPGTDEKAAPGTTDGTAASGARQFASALTNDGTVRLTRAGSALQSWSFAVTPDTPPKISFAEDPKRAANGALELSYTIEDDYGAANAKALFKRAEQASDAHALYKAPDLPLTMPHREQGAEATETSRDLTEHPWAGSTVELALEATDDAGQTGRSETKTFILPARPFTNPLARALVEQRRILALDANAKPRVLDLMDATTLWPEDTFDSMANYLAIVSARTRLDMAESDDQLREVVSYLWEIALNIENGDLTDAEKRLRQAQQALKDALERGAGNEEISELMKELRQAMQDYLREFAQRAQQNPNMAQQQMPENSQRMTQRDVDRMLDKIEDLAKSGSREQAQQLLSQLENMMNNLQAGRQQQGQQGGQQSEMRKQMDELGELMRRQQEMMNETFGLNQQQRGQQQRGRQGQQGEGQQDQGQKGQQGRGGMSQEELAEALRQLQEGQGQLREDLQGLTKGLEGMGIKPGEGFGDAGDAMGQAEGALGDAQGERAVGEQGRALEALRQGAQEMMNQMRQAMQGDQGGGMEGGRQQNADRDPLGRPRATNGPDFGDSVDVPDEIDIQRARRILEAIRKRLGDALIPAVEKDYLERLLDMQ